jgi:hypothetical protein
VYYRIAREHLLVQARALGAEVDFTYPTDVVVTLPGPPSINFTERDRELMRAALGPPSYDQILSALGTLTGEQVWELEQKLPQFATAWKETKDVERRQSFERLPTNASQASAGVRQSEDGTWWGWIICHSRYDTLVNEQHECIRFDTAEEAQAACDCALAAANVALCGKVFGRKDTR